MKALEGETVQSRSGKEVVIPAGHCWVEGDHKEHSRDSNQYGPVSVH